MVNCIAHSMPTEKDKIGFLTVTCTNIFNHSALNNRSPSKRND